MLFTSTLYVQNLVVGDMFNRLAHAGWGRAQLVAGLPRMYGSPGPSHSTIQSRHGGGHL